MRPANKPQAAAGASCGGFFLSLRRRKSVLAARQNWYILS